MAVEASTSSSEPHVKLTETLCTKLRRRQIVGSRNVALATARLISIIVQNARFTTFDELVGIIKGVGRRLAEANPIELAAGNIVRRVLRLFREEYRAALASITLSSPPSGTDTPLGPGSLSIPPTPGLHPPEGHYLGGPNDLSFHSPSASGGRPLLPSRQQTTLMDRQPSLSNFVAMRHSRAQSVLERSGSLVDVSLSASTSALFMTPSTLRETAEYPSMSSSTGSLGSPPSRSRRGSGSAQPSVDEVMKQAARLRPILSQAVDEVTNEIETTHEDVSKGAREHIHSSEVILTLGHSRTVETFLKEAWRHRKFTVFVAESAPSYSGHTLAASLHAHGIPTLLIPDSSVHAIIPRTTKLLIGAHTVLANGGLFAQSGALAACLAARAYAKPVVVTTGQFKFAPAWNLYHEFGAVDFQSPAGMLGSGLDSVEGVNPFYDYVKPELINLFVTNEGDHSPSYVYRIIKDSYDDEDVEL